MQYDDADEELRITAISYTKLRDQLGMVGISIIPHQHTMIAKVMLARHWESATEKMPTLPDTVNKMYQHAQWGQTYIEQETGEHIIASIHSGYGIPVTTINTMKIMKDATDIKNIKIMDRIEMTEYLSLLLKINKVLFPSRPDRHITRLEQQMPFWSRHTTEAGSVDYYAPGEEPDDLVRSLMICCFAARNHLGYGGAEADIAHTGPLATPHGSNKWQTSTDVQKEIDMQMAAAFPSYRT